MEESWLILDGCMLKGLYKRAEYILNIVKEVLFFVVDTVEDQSVINHFGFDNRLSSEFLAKVILSLNTFVGIDHKISTIGHDYYEIFFVEKVHSYDLLETLLADFVHQLTIVSEYTDIFDSQAVVLVSHDKLIWVGSESDWATVLGVAVEHVFEIKMTELATLDLEEIK